MTTRLTAHSAIWWPGKAARFECGSVGVVCTKMGVGPDRFEWFETVRVNGRNAILDLSRADAAKLLRAAGY